MCDGVLVSFCIPTNGVVEWVIPTIESIISQEADKELFEIVVSDNGNNTRFEEIMKEYSDKHKNICYSKNNIAGFLNQIETFRRAKGEFVKFVNHRSQIIDGAVQHFIEFAKENRDTKPVVFFLNGEIPMPELTNKYSSFDLFVKSLGYYSSWSAGIAMWKEQRDTCLNKGTYNKLFPHTDILFSITDSSVYIIDNFQYMKSIDNDATKKGKYNLFEAFAVSYPSILLGLLLEKKISIDTFHSVIDNLLDFICHLYIDFIIKKRTCSYELNDAKKYINVFYHSQSFKGRLISILKKRIMRRIFVKWT